MEEEEYAKIISRLQKQTGRYNSHLQLESDPVDNCINSRLRIRKLVLQNQEKKKEEKAKEQQKQEIESQIEESFKNLFD